LMKKTILLFTVYCLGQWAFAQDPFHGLLFSADFVISQKEAIGLNARQEGRIKAIHNEGLPEFSGKRNDLNRATEQLRVLLAAEKPDTRRISEQIDIVLRLENELKKLRMNNLLAIRQVLDSDQVALLQSLKQQDRPAGFRYEANEVVSIRSAGAGTDKSPAYYIDRKGEYSKVSDISLIEPKDIASIQVLKGEAALKKFGDAGSHGVIIITLKNDL